MADGSPNAMSYKLINMIRRRANNQDYMVADPVVDLPTGLSKDDFRQAVFEEKGWELACEQHRWNDLVRREKVVEMNLLHRSRVKMNLLLQEILLVYLKNISITCLISRVK